MKFSIQVASAPDRDELVAEIWFGSDMVAEVRMNSTSSSFDVDLYNNPRRSCWSFDLDSLVLAITSAKSKLQNPPF